MTAKPKSSKVNVFWMPVADPVINGDQVRHDDFETFYVFVNNKCLMINKFGAIHV